LQVSDAPIGLFVRADDRAPLEGIEDLGGVEAEYAQIAMAQHRAAFVLDSESMRRIVDDLEVVGVGNTLDRCGVAGIAVTMYRHDGRSLRGDRGLDLFRVEIQGSRVYVHEYRLDAIPQQRVGCSDERIRRGYDLAGNPQSLQCRDQGQSTVGEECNVLNPKMLAEGLLQLLVHITAIGKKAAVPYLL